MEWSGLPSLNSLRAFAVVAEQGSYSRAGAVLRVSHAAVNQHVRALEAKLGIALVIREGRGIRLTEAGAGLARSLALGFGALRDGVEALMGASALRPVQVTMPPAVAASWLMPRILDFQRRHPSVTLMLNVTAEVVELTASGLDLAIRFGDGKWPGMTVTPFMHPDLVVVGVPGLIGEMKSGDLQGAARLPWLQESGTDEVAQWMRRHAVTSSGPVKITHMPGNLILEAVRRGDGLTYTARLFVEDDIRSGRLVVLTSERDSGSYFIVTVPGIPRRPVHQFIQWLKQQASHGSGTVR